MSAVTVRDTAVAHNGSLPADGDEILKGERPDRLWVRAHQAAAYRCRAAAHNDRSLFTGVRVTAAGGAGHGGTAAEGSSDLSF